MAEPFSITKMLSGMLTGVHWAKTVSFGLSAAFLIFVGIGVWRGYFKKPEPTTTQNQSAERIDNFYHQPKATFGCATVRVYDRFPTNRMVK